MSRFDCRISTINYGITEKVSLGHSNRIAISVLSKHEIQKLNGTKASRTLLTFKWKIARYKRVLIHLEELAVSNDTIEYTWNSSSKIEPKDIVKNLVIFLFLACAFTTSETASSLFGNFLREREIISMRFFYRKASEIFIVQMRMTCAPTMNKKGFYLNIKKKRNVN